MRSEWKELPFTEAVEVNPKVFLEKGQEYPFVDMKAVDPSWQNASESEYRVFNSGGARFMPYDTLMARITPCLENGKIARFVPQVDNDGPAFGSTEFIVIRGREGVTENDFAYYLTKWQEFRNFAVSQMTGSSGRQRVPADSLAGFSVPIPELEDQRAIAHILGSLDDKIELNRQLNRTLEAMASAIFKSWFVDFDPVRAKAEGRDPGLPDEIAALFPDSFEDSELGEIPNGWVATTLGDEVDLQTGFPFKSRFFSKAPPGVRLARGMNVKEGVFYWDSQARYWPTVTPDVEQYLLQSGDVLVGMDGSKVGKNWVRVRMNDLPCLLVQRVARLRKATSVGENFLWIIVGSKSFRSYVDAVKTGTSIPHISGAQIKSYEFVRPPIGDDLIFDSFESIVAPLTEKVDANLAESEILYHIRDTLLPKLISNELRVEDAGKLLESVI